MLYRFLYGCRHPACAHRLGNSATAASPPNSPRADNHQFELKGFSAGRILKRLMEAAKGPSEEKVRSESRLFLF